MSLRLAGIHRYPIKSMGGELVGSAMVDERGLVGDRLWAVYAADGKLASGKHSRRFRRLDPVFGLSARTARGATAPSYVLPTGRVVDADDPHADAIASDHFGQPVSLRPEADVPHHDDAPVSLVGTATLAAVAELLGDHEPVDVRHFRTNLVIDTDEPWVEEGWVGRSVAVGEVELEVIKPTVRCRMVDVAQVGVAPNGSILKTLGVHRDLLLAVYAGVRVPGLVRVGDELVVA